MYGWLDKAIKLLMKNHEIRLICSILRSECSNKYYEFISCLCMAEQSNELLIENQETCPNWFCSIPISECSNKYYEFISFLCMAEQNNELLIKNHQTCPNWFCSIPRSECSNI